MRLIDSYKTYNPICMQAIKTDQQSLSLVHKGPGLYTD